MKSNPHNWKQEANAMELGQVVVPNRERISIPNEEIPGRFSRPRLFAKPGSMLTAWINLIKKVFRAVCQK